MGGGVSGRALEMFNALKYNLETVGSQRNQAEAQVQLVMDAINEDPATKSDLADLKAEFAGVQGKFAALRSEFAELRADVR